MVLSYPELLASMQGVLLRRTEIAEEHVLLLLIACVLATWLLLRTELQGKAVLKALGVPGAAFLAAVAVLGVTSFETLQELTWEDGILEWLTAHSLFIAWVLTGVTAARGAQRGRPKPMAAFLATGLFLGWSRELAWGRPFFGQRMWYSRNLFRLKPYLDPAYFEKFCDAENLAEQPMTLYWAHLGFSFLLIVLLVWVGVYLVRRRKRFGREVKALRRQAYGQCFLAGVGLYLGAQVLGSVFERIAESDATAAWRAAHRVPGHRAVSEPIELLGAFCFLLSASALWRACFARHSVSIAVPVTAK